jgi:hypothetical protein
MPQEVGSTIACGVNEDGEKLVYLPPNESYRVEITATEDCEMTYTVNEYNPNIGSYARVISYYDVPLEKGKKSVGNVPAFSQAEWEDNTMEWSSVNYGLQDSEGKQLSPDINMAGEEAQSSFFKISASTEDGEYGFVTGSGTRHIGEFAKVEAFPLEDCEFLGWYEGETLVSEEAAYRFKVEKDRTLVARFDGNIPTNFEGVMVYSDKVAQVFKLTWTSLNDATGYEIVRSDTPDGEFELVGEAEGGDTELYLDAEFNEGDGEYYYFKVRAKYEDGFSGYSRIAQVSRTVLVEDDSLADEIANALAKLLGESKIPTEFEGYMVYSDEFAQVFKLVWKSVDGATGYEIVRSDTRDGEYKSVGKIEGGDKELYLDAEYNAGDGLYYYYKIRSVLGKTFSGYSEAIEVSRVTLYSDDGLTAAIEELLDILDQAEDVVTDPLIIDLEGNGLDTISMTNGVYFDHKGNGFMVKTGWVGKSEGMLFRDINGNGKVDNGGELFGDFTVLSNGEFAANGFEALKDLDYNRDRVFDKKDSAWGEVNLWIDANSNGLLDIGERISLDDAHLASINLDYYNINVIDARGNQMRQISEVMMKDGSIIDAVDVWFVRNFVNSQAQNLVDVTMDVKVLPNIRGYGTTHSLHQSIMRDASGQLMTLIIQFIEEEDEYVRKNLISQIIYSWTGSKNNLTSIEALVGEKYTGNTGSANMAIINQGFTDMADAVYEYLMAQTHYNFLYRSIKPEITPQNSLHDMSATAEEILKVMDEDQIAGERLLLGFVMNLHRSTTLDKVDISGFRDKLASSNERYGILVDIATKNVFIGKNDNSTIRGTNSGDVFWLDRGNHTIESGMGDNIYFLGKDFGTNTITDNGGYNTIFFLSDMPQVNVKVMPDTYNVEISAVGGTGKLIIKNFIQNATYKLYFADGSSYDMNLMELVPSDDVINIRTVDDLNSIRTNLFGSYRLMANIDLEGMNWTPIGTSAAPFGGILDGNGYVIKNLNINLPNQDYVGLIGYNSGTIMNLGIEGGAVTGGYYTGGFVGYNTGTIMKSYTTANVKGNQNVGGFAGYMNAGTIAQSYATGNVSGTSCIGGFVGYITGSTSTVQDSFSIGGVAGGSDAAGFVGYIFLAKVTNCYSLANNANGFTGANSYGTVSSNYFDNDLLSISSAKPEARTTAQMMSRATYISWNFETVWEIEEGASYPTLRGMTKPIWKDHRVIEVYTTEQFDDIRNDLFRHYRLMADIDLAEEPWIPIGTDTAPFGGILDGNGYVVKNLNINLPNQDNVGLFGYNSGLIKALGIEGGTVTGRNYTGGFVGYNTGTIMKSYTTANVKGNPYVGGFAGYISNGTITQSYAAGNVSGASYIGGFVGYITGSTSTVRDSFSIGNVAGSSNTAGFVGYINSAKVTNCYSLANNTNGFAGANSYGTVSSNYFDNDLLSIPSTKLEARTTAQMMSQATYTGWDFEIIWEIEEGVGYPTLRGVTKPTWDIGYTEIITAEQLNAIRDDLAGNYRLMSDIDLKGYEWIPIGTNIIPFYGQLDGNGFTIKNLTINLPSQDYVGLFGYNSGMIINVKVIDGDITGRSYVGGLVGYNVGTVENSSVVANVHSSGAMGGFVGRNQNGIIKQSSSAGYVDSNALYIGGFVGENTGTGTIISSYSSTHVIGHGATGGFVGKMEGGTIEKSYATGNAGSAGSGSVGTFSGQMQAGIIKNCFSIGDAVAAYNASRGFVGAVYGGTIESCYMQSSNAQKFVNQQYNSTTISNSYFDGASAVIPSSASEARTAEQMMSQSTYAAGILKPYGRLRTIKAIRRYEGWICRKKSTQRFTQ